MRGVGDVFGMLTVGDSRLALGLVCEACQRTAKCGSVQCFDQGVRSLHHIQQTNGYIIYMGAIQTISDLNHVYGPTAVPYH